MRISDIIKRGGTPEPEQGKPEKSEEKAVTPQKQEPLDIESEVSGQELYKEAISVLEVFWKKLETGEDLNYVLPLKELSMKLVKEFERNPSIVGEVNNSYPLDNYLPYHSVNVCLVSIAIALRMEQRKEILCDIALTALLHDIGMTKVPKDILSKKEKLLPSDIEKIKSHPIHNKEILEKIKDITTEILSGVLQSHERSGGTGYPDGIKEGQIHSYAKIVGLADTYEALVHDRIYRKAISPYRAVKEIIRKNGQFFDHRVLKALIEALTFYPVGCIIELSNGEIGIVKNTNSNFPTRPYMKIILDERKKKVSSEKIIDLSKMPFVSIRQILKKEDVEKYLK